MEDNKSIQEVQRSYPPLFISFLTEFVATGILMWFGCMGCIMLFNIGPVIPAFSFGLAVTSVIQIFSHVSPVHVNPAVSVGAMILGKMHWKQFIVYLVAQYLGAIAGTGLLMVVVPWTDEKICLLHLDKFMTPIQGFFIEFGATVILMFAVCGATDIQNKPFEDSLALRLGLIVSGLVFASAPFTGAGLNPARALAPALLYNSWKDFWLYELAPFVGMTVAAVTYRFIFSKQEKYSLYTYLMKHCVWCIPS